MRARNGHGDFAIVAGSAIRFRASRLKTDFITTSICAHRISPEDFPRIEEEMKKEIKANHPFEKVVVSRDQALKDAESGRLGALSERPVIRADSRWTILPIFLKGRRFLITRTVISSIFAQDRT